MDIANYRHIRNRRISQFSAVAVNQKVIAYAAVIVNNRNCTFNSGGSVTVQAQIHFFIGVFVQFSDPGFPDIAGAYAFTPETDIAAQLANHHVVQLQVSIGQIVDLYPGRTVSCQAAIAVQIVGLHYDISAADRNFRNFHITDGKTLGCKYAGYFVIPTGILFIYDVIICIPCRNRLTVTV